MKKSSSQITDYYQKPSVVAGYDQRRFRGKGGAYIHTQEVISIIELFNSIISSEDATLELGSGRGRLTQYLSRLNANIYCLERSASMIGYLEKIVPSSQVLHQSIFDPIKTSKEFKVVTSLRFFEHFSREDQRKIINNIKTCLAQDGYLLYSGVNLISLEGLLTKFFPYGRYNYYYTLAQIEELFSETGFRVEKRKSHFFFPRGLFLYTTNPFLLAVVKKLDQLMVKIFPIFGAYQVYLLKRL